MADIEIMCPKCSRMNTVSEFVDGEALKCSGCGERLRKPAETPGAASKASGPKLKSRSAPVAAPGPEGAEAKGVLIQRAEARVQGPVAPRGEDPDRWQAMEAARQARPQRKRKFSHAMGSWVTFIVLSLIAGIWRYGDKMGVTLHGPPQAHLDLLQQVGPIIVISFNFLIVLKAFKDSVFHGILCLLLPFYSLYYIFAVSDDFYMRAVFMGLLVGIGQESGIVFQGWFTDLCNTIHLWIASGG